MPSASGTPAIEGAPGAAPYGIMLMPMTGTSVGAVDCSAAQAANRPTPVPMVELEVGRVVCVSLEPLISAVIALRCPYDCHGACGLRNSGLSVFASRPPWPGAWYAN